MDAERKKSLDDKINTLINRSLDFQDKFTYYILAINAACIGFALNYNKDAHYSWYLVPFIVAIVCWLVSFHYGIRELRLTDLIFQENQKYLAVTRMEIDKIAEQFLDKLAVKNERIVAFGKIKINFLYYGSVIFVLWYLLKIYINC